MNIVIVSKIPKVRDITNAEMIRLSTKGLGGQYIESDKAHTDVMNRLFNMAQRGILNGTFISINDIENMWTQIQECDLCITVGGDGTVLATQKYLKNQPIIAINSDPRRSQGFLTLLSGDDEFLEEKLEKRIRNFSDGSLNIKPRARLKVCTEDNREIPFFNEVLFTNENPAAMSEYVISCSGKSISERQRSSGVWISTPQGSTGAISSAGAHPIPIDSDHFIFKVREPYHGKSRLYELEGWFGGNDNLRLISATRGMRLYMDGSHTHYSPLLGEEVIITRYIPLNVVVW